MSAAAPTCPTMPGIDKVSYLTNSTIMDIDFLPAHLVVVGGSYIGLEFAQMYRRFGSQGHRRREGPAPDRARGRGHFRRDQGDPRGGRHRLPARRRMHQLLAARATASACMSTARAATAMSSARMCCSPSAAGPTPTISASTRPASRPTSAATSPSTTSCAPAQPHIWALGDCNGTRRLHPHRLQRFRDRRGEPARRRQPPRQRPHDGLCALHRSAARPRRHDRDGGAEIGPQDPRRHAADDAGRPRRRDGRDARAS